MEHTMSSSSITRQPAVNVSPAEQASEPQRRGFLKCMTWVGAGVLWTMSGGVPRSQLLGAARAATPGDGPLAAGGDFSFVQISDSHIGFANSPNTDTAGTLHE